MIKGDRSLINKSVDMKGLYQPTYLVLPLFLRSTVFCLPILSILPVAIDVSSHNLFFHTSDKLLNIHLSIILFSGAGFLNIIFMIRFIIPSYPFLKTGRDAIVVIKMAMIRL